MTLALGAVIRIQREEAHRPAGLRTNTLVSLDSFLFTIVSTSFSLHPARIAVGIVASIGFTGAGTIWAEQDKVKGVVTAASPWAATAIGLTPEIEDNPLATAVTILVFLILSVKIILKKRGLERTRDVLNVSKIRQVSY